MKIGNILLIGAAGFAAYEYFSGGLANLFGGAAPAAPTAPGIQTAPAGQTQVPITNPVTTQQMVLAAATKDHFNQGNVWQWDYYYGQARGVDGGTANYVPEADRMKILTFPEWWGIRQANGLGGYQMRG